MPSVESKKSKGKGKAAPAEAKVTASLPLGKQLAHTDKAVRDQAVRNLEAFLSRGSGEAGGAYEPLSDSEMAKLWKGLFYCFWMSDKPLVQQALATDLANLLLRIDPGTGRAARIEASLGFLDGFWTALVREWGGIDRLRIDKYYMLIRRYVNATFRLLAREEWDSDAVERVNTIIGGASGPMSWEDKSVPSSLASHLADVYLEELDKVLAEGDVAPAPVVALVYPHILLLARTRTQAVHTRLMSVVFTPLITALSPRVVEVVERPAKRLRGPVPVPVVAAQDDDDEDDEDALFAAIARTAAVEGKRATKAQAKNALLQAMFKEAAQEGAVESNRRKIYTVVREQGDDEDDE